MDFDVSISNYPADIYSLKWTVGFATPVVVDGTAVGLDFNVTVPAATTSAWLPGRMVQSLVFTIGLLKYIEGPWTLLIRPNPLLPLVPSSAQLALTRIETTLASLSSNKSTSVDGQTYTKYDMKELLEQRNYLLNVVNGELIALGIRPVPSRRVVTRFRSG